MDFLFLLQKFNGSAFAGCLYIDDKRKLEEEFKKEKVVRKFMIGLFIGLALFTIGGGLWISRQEDDEMIEIGMQLALCGLGILFLTLVKNVLQLKVGFIVMMTIFTRYAYKEAQKCRRRCQMKDKEIEMLREIVLHLKRTSADNSDILNKYKHLFSEEEKRQTALDIKVRLDRMNIKLSLRGEVYEEIWVRGERKNPIAEQLERHYPTIPLPKIRQVTRNLYGNIDLAQEALRDLDCFFKDPCIDEKMNFLYNKNRKSK